ncbi:NUDIX domain-containing protein, partial [Turicibacter sanguinis]|nr:NUDIX domain-containing protein [Turicibacter sanguinis]
MSIEKSCGIMVYHSLEKEPKFLLLQSRINNHWSFPKGHMEIGETEKETAIRE